MTDRGIRFYNLKVGQIVEWNGGPVRILKVQSSGDNIMFEYRFVDFRDGDKIETCWYNYRMREILLLEDSDAG